MYVSANPESAKVNGRKSESCYGRVFNSKFGHFAKTRNRCMACIRPHLELKTRPLKESNWGALKLTREDIKVVWAEFSTVS